jgi:hypothetical protein
VRAQSSAAAKIVNVWSKVLLLSYPAPSHLVVAVRAPKRRVQRPLSRHGGAQNSVPLRRREAPQRVAAASGHDCAAVLAQNTANRAG